MRRSVFFFAALSVLWAMGCAPSDKLTYFEDVKPLLDANCKKCHKIDGIAPFELNDYDDAFLERYRIREAVETRAMPPWLPGPDSTDPNGGPCADYIGDPTLSDEEIATIVTWVDQGAKEGKPENEGAPIETFEVTLSRVDHVLEMAEPYTPTREPDDYRCFLIDWPETETTFVTGYNTVPGNTKIVHHVIAYIISPADVPTVDALDAAEPGPGYTCFGGPGSDQNTLSWLGAWAPGGLGADYPEGTGIEVEPGSKIALQVHYNVLEEAPEPDLTSVEIKVDNAVASTAFWLPWTNFMWLNGNTSCDVSDPNCMMIPAGMDDRMASLSEDPREYYGFGAVAQSLSFRIHVAAMHMHTLGTSGRVAIEKTDGSTECLVDIPRWDFNWQMFHGFGTVDESGVNEDYKWLDPGDRVYMECHWDNTAGNQLVVDGEALEPRDVAWGDGTTDEMCLGVFYVSL